MPEIASGAVHRGVDSRKNREAEHLVAERPCDLALLDLALPYAAGIDAPRHIRAKEPEVPLVFLTSLESVHERALSGRRRGRCGAKIVRVCRISGADSRGVAARESRRMCVRSKHKRPGKPGRRGLL